MPNTSHGSHSFSFHDTNSEWSTIEQCLIGSNLLSHYKSRWFSRLHEGFRETSLMNDSKRWSLHTAFLHALDLDRWAVLSFLEKKTTFGVQLYSQLPPWCNSVCFFLSTHSFLRMSPDVVGVSQVFLFCCLAQFLEAKRAAPQIMMCMQWRAPLFGYFLNVKCADMTIRAQSAQEQIFKLVDKRQQAGNFVKLWCRYSQMKCVKFWSMMTCFL